MAAAQRHAQAAVRLLPTFPAGWWVAGEVSETQGRTAEAIQRFEKAAALGLDDPRALLHLAKLLVSGGRAGAARPYLERAARLGRGTPPGEDARRLLEESP